MIHKKLSFIKSHADLALFSISIIFICINILFSTFHFIVGDIFFHTDIARDLLLVQDLFERGSPVLIGPRAGGIGGTFFGPVFIYLSAPFYLIGNGNPMVIGLLYWLLTIFALAVIIFISKRIFGWQVALISGAIFSFYAINFSLGFTQTFGSVIISPILLYLIYRFLLTNKFIYLIFLMFLHGILLQFQPAFGVITLAITSGIVLYRVIKIKKFLYLTSFLLVFIPLLNYFVFEIRNNFLQIRSLIHFLTYTPETAIKIPFLVLINNRLEFFIGRLNLLQLNSLIVGFIFIIIFLFIFYRAYKLPRNDNKRLFLLLFYLYYLVFFAISFLFKGLIWDFYTLGFLPIAVIVFSSLYHLIQRKTFMILMLLMFLILSFSYRSHLDFLNNFSGNDASSWITNKKVAENIFNNEKNDFGYYVFSTDEFGYSVKYAMSYINKITVNDGELCKKRNVTYIIFSPFKFDSGEYTWWKNNKLKISAEPQSKQNVGRFVIERYVLTDEQVKIEHDPTVICDLHFR